MILKLMNSMFISVLYLGRTFQFRQLAQPSDVILVRSGAGPLDQLQVGTGPCELDRDIGLHENHSHRILELGRLLLQGLCRVHPVHFDTFRDDPVQTIQGLAVRRKHYELSRHASPPAAESL